MNSRPDWAALTREQRIEIMEPHRLNGATASEMAKLFTNCTRNSVIWVLTRAKRTFGGKAGSAHSKERSRQSAKVQHGKQKRQGGGGLSFAVARARKAALESGEKPLSASAAILGVGVQGAPREVEPVKIIVDSIPASQLIPLTSLTERTCKWPVGDPRDAGFGFCGAGAIDGKPYCSLHQRRAYHPS